jgi:Flp pilus assembly protein TadG
LHNKYYRETMKRTRMADGYSKTMILHGHGQSMVEFALILPLFVLFIVGIFELGRAFFSFIAISNAAREGARVATFWPGKTTGNNVVTAIETEIGNSQMVNMDKASYLIECFSGGANYVEKPQDNNPLICDSGKPIRVTVTYQFELILKLLFPNPITLRRSAIMMIP